LRALGTIPFGAAFRLHIFGSDVWHRFIVMQNLIP
jgi:hypothetical protein